MDKYSITEGQGVGGALHIPHFPVIFTKNREYKKMAASNTNLPAVDAVYVGDRTAVDMEASIISYDAQSARMDHVSAIDELSRYQDDSKISWINISGLKDIDAIKKMGQMYHIHPLSIEDVLDTEQQPKVEFFDEYLFLSIKTIQREKNFRHYHDKKAKREHEVDEFLIDQISMVVMNKVLITFQEIPGDSFNKVRKQILDASGSFRKMGTDYLVYALIDAIVDEYFLTINHLEDDIENFEDRAPKTNDYKFIEEIQDTKKYLLKIKRAVSPLKVNLQTIERRGQFLQTDALKPFLHDLTENLNNAAATIDHYHEWLSNIMAVNLSVLSHQMNGVMKVLAIISTIFIPLTFIAGIYGMNFENMPELKWAFGYPLVLGCMGTIALVMVIFFKMRRWF
jgi:magnesium transporter